MAAKNDQVFQLSLTEIAFMMTFLLMLILGLMVVRATKDSQDLLLRLKGAGNIEEQQASLDKAKEHLEQKLTAMGATDPDEVITKLIKDAHAQAEADRLKVVVEDQEARITALAEVQQVIKEAAKGRGDGVLVQKQIEQALILAKEVKEKLQERLDNPDEKAKLEDMGQLADQAKQSFDALHQIERGLQDDPELAALPGSSTQEKIEQLVKEYQAFNATKDDHNNPMVIKKENSDLKGQIQFLKNRLEANGGMDFPPCWADENGKVQMLLTVELLANELNISRAWPDSREQDAGALPNIKTVMASPVSDYASFLRAVKPISDLSRQQNCRHYIRIKNMINDAITADRRRLSIEDYFYKVEVRR